MSVFCSHLEIRLSVTLFLESGDPESKQTNENPLDISFLSKASGSSLEANLLLLFTCENLS